MPYKLRKAPRRDLYWVVNKETGKKYSKDPITKDKAEAQLRVLHSAESKELDGGMRRSALASAKALDKEIEAKSPRATLGRPQPAATPASAYQSYKNIAEATRAKHAAEDAAKRAAEKAAADAKKAREVALIARENAKREEAKRVAAEKAKAAEEERLRKIEEEKALRELERIRKEQRLKREYAEWNRREALGIPESSYTEFHPHNKYGEPIIPSILVSKDPFTFEDKTTTPGTEAGFYLERPKEKGETSVIHTIHPEVIARRRIQYPVKEDYLELAPRFRQPKPIYPKSREPPRASAMTEQHEINENKLIGMMALRRLMNDALHHAPEEGMTKGQMAKLLYDRWLHTDKLRSAREGYEVYEPPMFFVDENLPKLSKTGSVGIRLQSGREGDITSAISTIDEDIRKLQDSMKAAGEETFVESMEKGHAGYGKYRGKGFFDKVKAAYDAAYDLGKKAYNEVFNPESLARQRISDVSKGIRKTYPPSARKMLERYGNKQITGIVIRRDPIQSAINTAFNALTFGLWDKAKKQANYDKMFHLGLVLTLEGGIKVLVEKNEVINISNPKPLQSDSELLTLYPPNTPTTLSGFLENAQKQMGENFFLYDPFQNNCQDFVATLLKANDIYPAYAASFVKQSTDSILDKLPGYIAPVAKAITDIGGIANVALEGGTHREDFFKKHKLSPSMKPSLAKLAKISAVPKHILQEVYNRGIGAYKTQPKSVRLKGSFVKNVDAPMKKKLSKEQWAWARVYSFLNGNEKHDNDLRKNLSGKGSGEPQPAATPFTSLPQWELTWSQWSRAGLGAEVPHNATLPQLADYVNSLTTPQQLSGILRKILMNSPSLKGGGLSNRAALEQQLKGVDDYYNQKTLSLNEYFKETSELVQYIKEAIINEYEEAKQVIEQVKGGNAGVLEKAFETAGAVADAIEKVSSIASPTGLLKTGAEVFTSLLSTIFSEDFNKPTPITDYKFSDQLATDMGRIAGGLGQSIGKVVGSIGEMFGAKSQAEKNQAVVDWAFNTKYSQNIQLLNTFQEALKNEVEHKSEYYKYRADFEKKNRTDIVDRNEYEKAVFWMDRQKGKEKITFDDWVKAGRPKRMSVKETTPNPSLATPEQIHKAQYGYGSSKTAIEAKLEKIGYDPSAYLKEARRRAKLHGYPAHLLGFSDDADKKLQIPDTNGRIIRFGSVGNNDHLIWSYLEKSGKAKSGIASQKQNTFQKSHSKIKGDWAKNPFSPNNLALKILW